VKCIYTTNPQAGKLRTVHNSHGMVAFKAIRL
jgi:hypothetical protein